MHEKVAHVSLYFCWDISVLFHSQLYINVQEKVCSPEIQSNSTKVHTCTSVYITVRDATSVPPPTYFRDATVTHAIYDEMLS